jgi:multisubunit Na+/H+ antiporter MnhB subunit
MQDYQHLSQNDMLLNEQYGFRSNSSKELASFKLINQILLAINNFLTVGGIFCLVKAFDCVNHDIILSELELS